MKPLEKLKDEIRIEGQYYQLRVHKNGEEGLALPDTEIYGNATVIKFYIGIKETRGSEKQNGVPRNRF